MPFNTYFIWVDLRMIGFFRTHDHVIYWVVEKKALYSNCCFFFYFSCFSFWRNLIAPLTFQPNWWNDWMQMFMVVIYPTRAHQQLSSMIHCVNWLKLSTPLTYISLKQKWRIRGLQRHFFSLGKKFVAVQQ